jgi:SNF2 family DNA or RNA helicase
MPDHTIVIIDESVFFLDILTVAIRRDLPISHQVVLVLRYDRRSSIDERDAVMARFIAAEGARVLLASRATGVQGLNLQSVNALIRCGPWWKVSWEQQAEGRIHRYGQ